MPCLQLIVVASHGTLNSFVFFYLWYRLPDILGGHRTLPDSLKLGHLRRLQEWEVLMRGLNNRQLLFMSSASGSDNSGDLRVICRRRFKAHQRSSSILNYEGVGR